VNWSQWVRQIHRWVSIAFTATVLTCFVALALKWPIWVFYLPLPAIAVLIFTGLYLFVLPYVAKRTRTTRN
jgi:hypothetical protein